MPRRHAVIDSPVGPLTIVMSDAGLAGLYMKITKRPLTTELTGLRDDAVASEITTQLGDYFRGDRREFDLPLSLEGTAFQKSVWNLLLQIPFGERVSYSDLARELGDPRAVRAVGTANGSNPVSIVVPCHRVVGADGSLTGYAGGVERKRFLLDLESRVTGANPTLF